MVAALATVTAGSLYSCKDYDDEIYAELDANKQQQDATLKEKIEEQQNALNDAKTELEGLLNDAKEEQKNLMDDLQAQIDQNKSDMEKIYATKEELSKVDARVEVLETNIKKIQELKELLEQKADKSEVQDALNKIVVVENSLTTIQSSLEALDLRVQALEDAAKNHVTSEQLKEVSDAVAKAQGEIDANKAWAEAEHANLKKLIDKNAEDLKLKADKADVEKLQEDLAKLQKSVDEKEAALKQLIADEIAKVNTTIDTKISEVRKDFEAADKALQDQINTLTSDVAALQNEVKKISVLEDKLNQMITSVLVNGAKSPVVGYFSLPTGMKSNILAAYYGTVQTNEAMGLEFPSRELSQLVGSVVKGDTIFVNGETMLAEGNNAGKVYVTVNPSSVDMKGKTFSLVNSLGELAPMSFGNATLSNDKLSFGYTRAAENKNFYEIPARLSADQIANAKLRIEMSDLKEAVKQVKDAVVNKSGLDVTNLASTIFMCINDIADANAVKVSWSTKETDGSVKQHDVMTDFGLAAVAVKPLSYEFMKDYEINNFWGIDEAYNLLNKVVAEAKEFSKELANQFPHIEVTQPRIDTITLEKLDSTFLSQFKVTQTLDKTFTLDVNLPSEEGAYYDEVKQQIIVPEQIINVKNPDNPEEIIGTATVPGRFYDVKDKKVIKNNDGSFTVRDSFTINYVFEVDMRDAVKELYDKIGEAIGDANEMVKEIQRFFDEDIQELLDQINGMGAQFEGNLNEMIDKVNGKLTGLIGKVNNGLCKIVNNVNETLQPVMFAQGVGDFVMVSRAENVPSVYPSSFVLVPSSFTGEYLAPAAHKYVAVTKVTKNGVVDGSCTDILKSTNQNNVDLNKVLSGDNHAIAVQNLAKGYTYEFTYSAIDFYGKVRNTKCYVTVK